MRSFLGALAALVLVPTTLVAQAWNIHGVAAMEVLQGYPTQQGHMFALRIRLKPGWKTYWRAPGGNGIPPRFDWQGSHNVAAVEYHWPAPSIFDLGGVRTIGYANELVLPIAVKAQDAGRAVSVNGSVEFGICEDVCIPVEARFAADLDRASASHKPAIDAALRAQPRSARTAGVSAVTCQLAPADGGIRLDAAMRAPDGRAGRFAIVELPGGNVWVEQAPTRQDGRQLQASATIYPLTDAPLIVDRSALRITLLGGGGPALELRGC